jgi:hypothetical protein
MNVKKLSILASVTCLALISGCTKETGTTESSSFKYTKNGVAFSGIAGVQKAGTALNITGASSFTGTVATYPYGIIVIANYTGVKTYDISLAEAAATIAPNSTSSHPGIYGKVIITAATPNIVGTFYFTSLDSVKVTNGSFSVKAL